MGDSTPIDVSIAGFSDASGLYCHHSLMKTQRTVPLMFLFLACSSWGQKPELVVETGHTHDVTSVAFSPKREIVGSGGADGTVALWDVATGHELIDLGNQGSEIRTVAFSPDGTILASGAKDIKLWDVAGGRELRTLKSSDSIVAVHSVAFSPDGKTLASAGERWIDGEPGSVLTLWDVATGVAATTLKSPTTHSWQYPGIQSVAFSPDGRTLLAADGDEHKFSLRSASSGTELRNFAGAAAALSVAFNRNGKTMASADGDGTVKLWDVDTGRELANLGNCGRWVEFSPDGAILASGDKNIKFWDVATRRELRTLEGSDSERLNSIAFSPDGRILVSGGSDSKDRTWARFRPFLRLWDLTTNHESRALGSHVSSLHSIALSPDGTLLASGGDDQGITIWNLRNRDALRTLSVHNHAINSVGFSANGATLASGSEDGVVKLWDVATERIRTFGSPNVSTSCCITALSADGLIVASTSKIYTPSDPDSPVQLWDVRSGLELRSLHGPIPFRSIALSPRGETLAAADERAITLWNVSEGRTFLTLPEGWGSGLTFSPDGRALVSASADKGTHVWDVANGRELLALSLCGQSFAFSPDGRILAAAADTTIKLYDLASGRELRSFANHGSTVSSVTFQSDGRYLFSGSVDGWVRIWDPDTGTQVAALIALDQIDWAIVDPKGRFDTSDLDGGLPLHWLIPNHLTQILPLEIFMRDYYTPGLLATIMKGQQNKLPKLPSIAEIKNRVQPDVMVVSVMPSSDGPDRVDVVVHAASHVEQKQDVQGTLQKDANGNPLTQPSGLQDLRLFRDGQMVGSGYVDVSAGCAGAGTPARRVMGGYIEGALNHCEYTFHDVLLKAGAKKVTFTAYAFNSERIKSATATLDYEPKPFTAPASKPKAFLLQIGVNHYAASRCELSYSVNDAEKMSAALAQRLNAQGYDVQAVKLESAEGGDTEAAGKEAIRKQLASIAAQATPDDVFFMSFSGHGYSAEDGDFYILPSDIQGSCRAVDGTLLKSAISADELASWLRRIDAGEMTLILDACFSAESVQAGDFKPGPLGSRGLGQLAYDKRMRVLAASQSDEVAHEYDYLQQGLLTYVLTHDGLDEGKADWKPVDKKITVGEWLAYAADAVPKFVPDQSKAPTSKAATGRFGSSPTNTSFQVPALFNFSKTDTLTLQ